MTEVQKKYDSLLDRLIVGIDISPADYQRAVDSYSAVGSWLVEGFKKGEYPNCIKEPEIYPQGSFNLGTIIRPLKDGKESDFDIDLVCETMYKSGVSPSEVKNNIGERLKKNEVYLKKLDAEGRRCWTLEYENQGKTPFHMDILPCKPEAPNPNISITDLDKEAHSYSWRSSSPRGYAAWFKSRNITQAFFSDLQKRKIFESAKRDDGKALYESVQDVPDLLVRTPLQRTIQLLKRHRDVHYSQSPNKPISMIITTLVSRVYNGERTLLEALQNAVNTIFLYTEYMSEKRGGWSIDESMKSQSLISRRQHSDGYWEWYIPNPVNNKENFADKWHENNNARAKAFFSWIELIRTEMEKIEKEKGIHIIYESMARAYGNDAAKRALDSFGEEAFTLRNEGKLFFAAGTGILGTQGSDKVKGHTFYGENDSQDKN